MKNIELRGQRAELIKNATALVDNAQAEGRSLNAEEQQKFDRMEADARSIMGQIETLERSAEMKKELAAKTEARQAAKKETAAESFSKYLRDGLNTLSVEQRSNLTSSDASGGFIVPQGFSGELDIATEFTGEVERLAKKLNTGDGGPLDYPTINDTSNDAAKTTEGAAVSTTDLVFANASLSSYAYTSNVRVSMQLLQDSAFDLDGFLVEALGERIARKTNADFTNGDGSGDPQGILYGSGAGATAAAAAAIAAGDVLNLIHSIDPSYRNKPTFGLMAHNNVISAIRKLGIGSSNDFPIFTPSMVAGQPDLLFGHPIYYNNDMESSIATGNKVLLAADFSKFVVRSAGGIQMIRLNERYMDELEVGFTAVARKDSKILDTRAVKHLVMA